MVQSLPSPTKSCVQFVRADTANERPADREEYWNEVVRKHLVQLDCKADSSQTFLCAMDGFSCDQGAATRIHVERRLTVRRGVRIMDREASDAVVFNLLLAGQMHVAQADNACVLHPGDFSICTTDRPYQLEIPTNMQVACFRVPVASLGCNGTLLKRLAARRLGTQSGMAALVKAYAVTLLEQKFDAAERGAVVAMRHLGLLLGAAAEQSLDANSWQATDHRERIMLQAKYYVALNIDDSALSVAAVASALRISTRYLQQLWSAESDSLAGYVADMRLKRVAASLRNPARASESLTQIAMSHGFNNMSHFSRTFRQKYGVTPSAFKCNATAPNFA